MKALDKLLKAQEENNSMICLGLDLDPKHMPSDYTKDSKGIFDFAQKIVNATSDKVCAYKPNLAFYESFGTDGISILKMIIDRIPENIPVILDAKRGDIGNTASHYAHALFDLLGADWVTMNPYMGYDSLRPFLEYKDKGTFILCLTSNPGSKDFQVLKVDNKPLYQIVAEKVVYWNKSNNCGLVIGATAPQQLKELRAITESMPLLIPGVGAQGGSLEEAAINGTDNFRKPALINVSRSILYASTEDDFAERSRSELIKLNTIISKIQGNGNEVSRLQSQKTKNEDHKEPERIIVHEQPIQKEPEYKTSDDTNNSDQQNQTSTHIQHDQKDEHIVVSNNDSQNQEPKQNSPKSEEQKLQSQLQVEPIEDNNQQLQVEPINNNIQPPPIEPSDNNKLQPSQESSVDQSPAQEKKQEESDKPKPKQIHKIIPPPILKPPPLPYSNKNDKSDNNK